MKYYLVAIFLIIFRGAALACVPITPKLIPPVTRDGEFTVEYPPTSEEYFVSRLKRSSDIALAVLYLDYRDPKTKNSQTELRVLRGWGKPNGELLKFVREVNDCGEPEKLEEGDWYVVIYNSYGNPSIIKYEAVKKELEKLGPTTYAYTGIGLVPK